MFRTLKLDATRVYLFMEMAVALSLCLVFETNSLYEATVAGLAPLQLVLIGTTLEISTFLFEVPTGIVADIYSRRLSIIIGYVLMGLGFSHRRVLPGFWTYSFRSGYLGPGIHLYQRGKTSLDHR